MHCWKHDILARRTVIAWMICLFAGIFGPVQADETTNTAEKAAVADDPQKSMKLDTQVRVQMDYLLYLPEDYESKESWPLVLFLHGSGERGTDLELVRKHGPPKLIAEGKKFPCIIVSPQCPPGKSWEAYELNALLDELCGTLKVDQERISVTGLSMGGFGTWQLANFAPARFSAIAPICGGGETRWPVDFRICPSGLSTEPRMKRFPVMRSQEMADAIRAAGGHPQLTIYPEAQHDSWTETYNNPAFFEWLLLQKRVTPP